MDVQKAELHIDAYLDQDSIRKHLSFQLDEGRIHWVFFRQLLDEAVVSFQKLTQSVGVGHLFDNGLHAGYGFLICVNSHPWLA